MSDKTSTDTVSDAAKAARERLAAEMQAEATKTNDSRTGKGLRVFVGMTRGKGTQVISYEGFDESKPETLPKTYAEFSELTGVSAEAEIVSMLVDGFNAQAYQAASDPVAEFVNPSWPAEAKTQFRNAVRNYAKLTNSSIEDAVAIIKPGVEKALSKA